MENPKVNLPEWLKKTQNNSWEPEVFISGIVLFGLIQVPELLESFKLFFRREVFGMTSDIDNLIAVLMTSIQWLVFGLILHLFFRGIWIGLVGLSYVFPKGIKNENLNYKGKFANRVKTIPDFTNQIVLLEKISSSIFSISYFIFMSILGAYIYFAISGLLPFYLFITFSDIGFKDFGTNPAYLNLLKTYLYIIIGVGTIYLFDFLTLGLLRKNKLIARLYYPVYKFVSLLTLSALYRNIYYILISNFRKWKVGAFIVCFLMITFYLIGLNAQRTAISSQFSKLEMYGVSHGNSFHHDAYANLMEDGRHQNATIQSDIITDNVLKLFITHYSAYDDSVKVLCDYKKLETTTKSDSLKLECLGQFYLISVDDSLYTNVNWFFHQDPKSLHRGITSYLDISHLGKGMHKANIDMKNWGRKNYAVIPFYKE